MSHQPLSPHFPTAIHLSHLIATMIILKRIIISFCFLKSICYAENEEKSDCSPHCKVLKSPDGSRPVKFRDCVCVRSDELPEKACRIDYRSLKFRNETTGSVIRQKAVVAACITNESIFTIAQPEFEEDEQAFLKERTVLDRLVNVERRYSNWVFGFRTNLISFYNVDDYTLRFGRK